MKITKPADGKTAYNKNSVIGRKILSIDEVEVVHMEVGPGKTLPLHKTPVEVFFYILEGKGEIEIGDERAVGEPDTLVESPKYIPHALHNPGTETFRLLVVKTPRPA